MPARSLIPLLIGACAILLVVGLTFSLHVTREINNVARHEAQTPVVPTPAALAHAKPKTAVPASSHA